MKHIAITGGIGSGKSYVCDILRSKGYQVYDSDKEARRIINTSPTIKEKLINLIGPDAYKDGVLNKEVVTKFLLESEENKQAINAITIPEVMEDYYNSGITFIESAIIFDAHMEDTVDFIIGVIAPEDLRIKRIMNRDNVSKEFAEEWINVQLPQSYIIQHSNELIFNDDTNSLAPQINYILEKLKYE